MDLKKCPICKKPTTVFSKCNVCHKCKIIVSSDYFSTHQLIDYARELTEQVSTLIAQGQSKLHALDVKYNNDPSSLSPNEKKLISLLDQYHNSYAIPLPKLLNEKAEMDEYMKSFIYNLLLLEDNNFLSILKNYLMEEEK